MLEQICLAPLKGNVRELENLLHRAVALSEGNDLQVDILSEHTVPASLHAPLEVARPAGPAQGAAMAAGIPSDLQSHLDRQEREILVQTLRETGFNRTAAAARLGLSLRQIRYRIARLQIDVPVGPEASEYAD
jgi:two-component system response regulator PilR (NtrC family)